MLTLDERLPELVALLGEAGARQVRRSLQRMADAFRFVDAMQEGPGRDADAVAAALRQREERMRANFDELLTEWPQAEKMILLGHALHLSKHSQVPGRGFPASAQEVAPLPPLQGTEDGGSSAVAGNQDPSRAP